MNVRRIVLTVLTLTVFLIPVLCGLTAGLVVLAARVGWELAQDAADWLAGPLEKP